MNRYIQVKATLQGDAAFPDEFFTDEVYVLYGPYTVSNVVATVAKIDEKTALISFNTHDGGHISGAGEEITIKFNTIANGWPHGAFNGPPETFTTEYMRDFYDSDAILYFGDWEISIPTSNALEARYVDGTFAGRYAEVRIEATVIEIKVYGDEGNPYYVGSPGFKYDTDGTMKITLADGTVIESARVQMSGHDGPGYGVDTATGRKIYGLASYWDNEIEFINPSDVVRIELFDEVVFARHGNRFIQYTQKRIRQRNKHQRFFA